MWALVRRSWVFHGLTAVIVAVACSGVADDGDDTAAEPDGTAGSGGESARPLCTAGTGAAPPGTAVAGAAGKPATSDGGRPPDVIDGGGTSGAESGGPDPDDFESWGGACGGTITWDEIRCDGKVEITGGAGGGPSSDLCGAADASGGAEVQCAPFVDGGEYYGERGAGCIEYKTWELKDQCVIDGQCCYVVHMLWSEP